MLRLDENPPMLLAGVETLAQIQGHWWVAHTKSRFEKAFAWDLLRRRIAYYLPLVERTRVSGGRKRRVLAPLFPSYVFVCGSEEDRYRSMATDRLCRTIEVVDQERLALELGSIERVLSGRVRLDPYPHAAIGRRCRVKAGPMAGVEGIVVQRNQTARLVLEVSMLGQGAALEIEADLVEPV